MAELTGQVHMSINFIDEFIRNPVSIIIQTACSAIKIRLFDIYIGSIIGVVISYIYIVFIIFLFVFLLP